MCKYCESTRETLTHMLFECPKVKQFWLKVIDWWNKKRADDVTVTSSDILYGYKPESTSTYTFNHFLLIAKFFIFQAKQANHPPRLSRPSISSSMIKFAAKKKSL